MFLQDTGSQAAYKNIQSIFSFSIIYQQRANIVVKLYYTVRVEDSGLYKWRFNHFKPPEKLSHKHQVVTLQDHTSLMVNLELLVNDNEHNTWLLPPCLCKGATNHNR